MCVVLFSVSYFHLFSLFFDLECLQCNLNLVRESEKEKNWKKNLAKLTGIFWQKKVKIYVWIYRYFSMSKIVWIQFRCCSTKHIFSLSFFDIWWDIPHNKILNFFYPLDHSPATTVQPAYGLFQETKNDYVVHVNPNQKYEDSLNQATFYHSTTVSPPIQVFWWKW